ncbi:MAG: hypothetical protein ABL904_01985 [Hyphomicrobiaceae bacterium]
MLAVSVPLACIDQKLCLTFDAKLAGLSADPVRVQTAVMGEGTVARVRLRLPERANALPTRVTIEATARSPFVPTTPALPGGLIYNDTMYVGIEHPMAHPSAKGAQVAISAPIDADERTVTLVVGMLVPGAPFRNFRGYIEEVRAHPSRSFLHYNTWYDLAWAKRTFDQSQVLATLSALRQKLELERNFILDGAVLDDGWDTPDSLWQFHSGFPDGFKPVLAELTKSGTVLGTWLSPWGGYNDARERRLAAAKQAGLMVGDAGFMLSDKKYYQLFLDACLRMIREQGVRYLKLDGFGSADDVSQEQASGYKETLAFLRLAKTLQRSRTDLFINATVGTWPSPFWLLSVDSLWRQGQDSALAGTGTTRDQWITYRDQQVHDNVVKRAPYFPINGLMLHGIQYAKLGQPTALSYDPMSFKRDVRSYFATGVNLQELYISPELLSDADWDVLVEAAMWARSRRALFADSHWVGGAPLSGAVYGYASWGNTTGTLSLRNGGDKQQLFCFVVEDVLEVPTDMRGRFRTYQLSEPWRDPPRAMLTSNSGEQSCLELAAHELRVFDAEARSH